MIGSILKAAERVGGIASTISLVSKYAPEMIEIIKEAGDVALHPGQDGVRAVLMDIPRIIREDRARIAASAEEMFQKRLREVRGEE